jgi:hypothetical protein
MPIPALPSHLTQLANRISASDCTACSRLKRDRAHTIPSNQPFAHPLCLRRPYLLERLLFTHPSRGSELSPSVISCVNVSFPKTSSFFPSAFPTLLRFFLFIYLSLFIYHDLRFAVRGEVVVSWIIYHLTPFPHHIATIFPIYTGRGFAFGASVAARWKLKS